LRLVSDEPGAAGEQPLVSRLRAVIAAKDEQIAVLQASQARLDLGNRRDGRMALACGGGVNVALYVETHEEAPRFGLIHPALPLFDLAAECHPDEHRN
jgi:hypothetical protein